MNFSKWLDTLVEEKGYDTEDIIEVEGASGTNWIPLGCLLDAIKSASQQEKDGIKRMIVRIDFVNGNVMDYFKHLAQAIAI